MQPHSPPISPVYPSAPAPTAWVLAQRERWDRIGLGVRLGYNPSQAQVLRLWLALGDHLVAQGVLSEPAALQRVRTILLQAAHDEGLPWFWRSVCLEHTARPLARSLSWSRRQVQALAPDVQKLHAAVLAAQQNFALPAQRPAA